MTLEDFFTLTEMKDGLTVLSRVEELVAVMRKEKDSCAKNVGDVTRQWAAVAGTIEATENEECLNLFIQLDGLWFIDRWLREAQTFSTEASDCFVEEAISALLQAVGKLQINNERLTSSGIGLTVKSLLNYNNTRVQEKARALFDSWKVKNIDGIIRDVERWGVDDLSTRSFSDQKKDCVEGGEVKMSNDQDYSQITSNHGDCKDSCPDNEASLVKLESVGDDLDPLCPSDTKQGTSEAKHATEDGGYDSKIESCADRSAKIDTSCASRASNDDANDAEEDIVKPDIDTNDAKDDLSMKTTSLNDTNRLVGESSCGMDDSGDRDPKRPDRGDGCPTLEENKDPGTTIFSLEDVGKYDEVKSHRKSERKYFGNTRGFARLTKNSKKADIFRQTTNMDLEDGTFDALEVARLVAKEVEREVGDYDEQSGSFSSERISRGGISQPDSPESINGQQEVEIDNPINESPTRENVSSEPSEKEPLVSSVNIDTNLENHVQDMESSQVTQKSVCEFDLNQEVSSEDIDHQMGTISNRVSIVSAARTVMTPGVPGGPLHFEGTLGWKGSAATSAFRPASPRRASDSDRGLSGGGTSSGSRHRQDFLDIDLNVAEDGDDKIVNQSSVELSSKRPDRLKFDLNQVEEDFQVSPASSSSCLQPCMKNFDLNDNPSNCNDLSDHQPFLGGPSSHKIIPFLGPPDDNVISILGTKFKKNTFPPQTPLPYPNGRAPELVMDANLLRGRTLMGLGPAVPYPQSVYGYNGLAMGPTMSFSSGPMYGPGGPIPYMFDSRGAPVVPQIIGSTSTFPPPYGQSPIVMNMMVPTNGSGPLRPNLDLNSGYPLEGGSRDPAFFGQLFIPGQGRPLEEQVRHNFQPLSSGASSGKRKEPDNGWEFFPTNYKHHQPPHL